MNLVSMPVSVELELLRAVTAIGMTVEEVRASVRSLEVWLCL